MDPKISFCIKAPPKELKGNQQQQNSQAAQTKIKCQQIFTAQIPSPDIFPFRWVDDKFQIQPSLLIHSILYETCLDIPQKPFRHYQILLLFHIFFQFAIDSSSILQFYLINKIHNQFKNSNLIPISNLQHIPWFYMLIYITPNTQYNRS